MPADDDRDWVNSKIYTGRDNRTSRGLPMLSLIGKVSYHLFGTAQASDVKYNRGMINTINCAVGEMNEDMADMSQRARTTLKIYICNWRKT